MPSPVVHFEIRSSDPDATRSFYGELFGWTFPEGGIPGYSYVDTGVEGAIPGGISPLQGGGPIVTFFVGVQDVAATLDAAPRPRTAGRSSSRQHRCRGSPSGCWPTRRARSSGWRRQTASHRRPRPARPRQTEARMPDPADSALLTQAVAGDDAAFAQLVAPYQGPVFRHCYRMLGSGADAEDATQDTLERAWRKLAAPRRSTACCHGPVNLSGPRPACRSPTSRSPGSSSSWSVTSRPGGSRTSTGSSGWSRKTSASSCRRSPRGSRAGRRWRRSSRTPSSPRPARTGCS